MTSDEQTALQQRIAELEQQVVDLLPYRTLFEHLPVAALLYESDGMAIAANHQNEVLMNIPSTAVVGNYNIVQDPEAQKQGYVDYFNRARQGEVTLMPPTPFNTSNTELEGRYADTQVWIETFFFPVYDAGGTLRYVGEICLDVGKRVQASQELEGKNSEIQRLNVEMRQSQQLLQQMIDSLPAVVFAKSVDGTFLLANKTAEQVIGIAREQMIGKNQAELFPAEAIANWQDQQARVQAANAAVHTEEEYPGPDGPLTFMSSMFPLYDENEHLYAFGGISMDITERKRVEQDLRASEAKNRALLDALPDLMFLQARDGTYLDYKSPDDQLYAPPEVFLGKTMYDVLPPDLAQQFDTAITRALDGQKMQVIEYALPMQGIMRYYETRVTVVDSDRVLALVRDITERKRMEEELQLFKLLVENAADGIGVANLEGVITYANPSYCTMIKYGGDMAGTSIFDVYNEPPEKMAALMQQVSEQGAWQGELSYRRKDGSTFPGTMSVFSIMNEQGTVQAVASIIRDVTEQKRQQEEHAALQEQIINAQRAALRELSTPLIPVSNDVVIMPLIGTIDSGRAQQVMETLLEGVSTHQAELAILDITGVSMVDTQVAQALVRAAQAVRLLGARVVLTGIQPQIAQTLVHLGVDLSDIVTHGSLQAGILYALDRHNN